MGQNYFTFGKGHTDEQDKAFIADIRTKGRKLNVISERAKTHMYDPMTSINGLRPYQSMYNADGTPADMETGVWLGLPSLQNPDLGLKSATFNLLDERNMNFNKSRRNNIRSFVHANVKILPELTLSARFQYE